MSTINKMKDLPKVDNEQPIDKDKNTDLKNKIEDVLRSIYDPEIPVNIFDLGLIYKIEIADQGAVRIEMTLTAPGCPIAGDIVFQVQTSVEAIQEISSVDVQLTFDPPWTRDMMSEEAKIELGF